MLLFPLSLFYKLSQPLSTLVLLLRLRLLSLPNMSCVFINVDACWVSTQIISSWHHCWQKLLARIHRLLHDDQLWRQLSKWKSVGTTCGILLLIADCCLTHEFACNYICIYSCKYVNIIRVKWRHECSRSTRQWMREEVRGKGVWT